MSLSIAALTGQLTVGLINGSFYALLSLGVAIIFGLLRIVNFAHGSLYMLGAFGAWLALNVMDLSYWAALVAIPLFVGAIGALMERFMLQRLAELDPIYGLLLTFGVALLIEGLFQYGFGSAGRPYPPPPQLRGATSLGFVFLPIYRIWAVAVSIVVCFATWFAIERTRLGAYVRAATENPSLVQVFGVNVPMLITLTFAGGAALAGLAGVLAAPIFQVSPLMGSNLVIVVFAVVVIGGMGSIVGSIVAGYGLGLLEAIANLFYPKGSSVSVFVLMALVLLLRPGGLFGQTE